MPIVQVKGTDQQIRFPDDMSREQILQVMRQQWPTNSYANALNMTTQGSVEPVQQTLGDRLKQGIADTLYDTGIISDRYGAQRIGENLAMGAEALPVIGDAIGGDDLGRALREGDAAGIGFGALAALPVVGDAAKSYRRVYHTSPNAISSINDKGRFGANLFFSDEPYFMTAAKDPKVYFMDIDETKIIEAKQIPYMDMSDDQKKVYIETVKNVANKLKTDDLDLAYDILTERKNIYEYLDQLGIDDIDAAEYSWDLQKELGDLGKKLGFDAVSASDEQGEVLIANMLGKEGNMQMKQNRQEVIYENSPNKVSINQKSADIEGMSIDELERKISRQERWLNRRRRN